MSYIILTLSVFGLGFSGYLGSYKFFSDTCALGETCPYFLGYPSCYYGFGLFVILTIISFYTAFKHLNTDKGLKIILWVSGAGILFAGYFTLGELPKLFVLGLKAYVLGLPSCALGLIFYIIIFVLAKKLKKVL